MKYKMAAEGKKLDGGTGYDMVSKDGVNEDAGMGYSMGGGESSLQFSFSFLINDLT